MSDSRIRPWPANVANARTSCWRSSSRCWRSDSCAIVLSLTREPRPTAACLRFGFRNRVSIGAVGPSQKLRCAGTSSGLSNAHVKCRGE